MAMQFKSQTKANKLIITTLPENQKFKNFWACMYDFKRNIPTSQLLAGSPKYVLINIAGDKRQDKGEHAWAPGAWTWTITL